jgi:hypothetical protein
MLSKLTVFVSPFLAAAAIATALVATPATARAEGRPYDRVDALSHERAERRWERARWERERREHERACDRAWHDGASPLRLRQMGCYAR